MALVALATVAGAWAIGAARVEADLQPVLKQALPQAQRFEATPSGVYRAWRSDDDRETLVGHVAVGTANGYSGPVELAVATDLEGRVAGLAIVRQRETPAFAARVFRTNLLRSLLGRSYGEPFVVGQDVDNVTGATYTARALADAARRGSRAAASLGLQRAVLPEPAPRLSIGFPEITVVALFVAGFVGRRNWRGITRYVRWGSMLTGLVVLGFMYNCPLTLTNINGLLMGFWPTWQTHLYWYLLIGGILLAVVTQRTNAYCDWFCPFGAAQECLAAVGRARGRGPARFSGLLTWIQRGLAWSAILVALALRDPGVTSYEVFGTLFDLTGSSVQFLLLALVLTAALFIRRPWCRYLCPLRPVTDMATLLRRWAGEPWNRKTIRARV